jgi:hypothetical protein
VLQVGSIEAATEAHPKADVFINFSSFRRSGAILPAAAAAAAGLLLLTN